MHGQTTKRGKFHALHKEGSYRLPAQPKPQGYAMNRKTQAGIAGMAVGGLWLLANLRHVQAQGFVAIGMPLIILVLGGIYFALGRKE